MTSLSWVLSTAAALLGAAGAGAGAASAPAPAPPVDDEQALIQLGINQISQPVPLSKELFKKLHLQNFKLDGFSGSGVDVGKAVLKLAVSRFEKVKEPQLPLWYRIGLEAGFYGFLILVFIMVCRVVQIFTGSGLAGFFRLRRGLPPTQRMADAVASTAKFDTWLDLLGSSDDPCIREAGPKARHPLTYRTLQNFARGPIADLNRFGIGLTDRVCTAIPNGPEAAVSFLALALRCTLAPLDMNLTEAEMEFEFEDLPCHTLIVMRGGPCPAGRAVAAARKLQVLELIPDPNIAGLFTLELLLSGSFTPGSAPKQHAAQGPSRQDVALVLHTSGTTKKPKIVPLTHENLVTGALCISSTLELKPSDICVNLMPLFHIHGLAVNVLATALSGASVVCTPGWRRDGSANLLQYLDDASWYSAVPTIHQALLEQVTAGGQPPPQHLQLIRNCSAALLPTVADRMEGAFLCKVMPTYAMTESMPIASNPRQGHRNLRSVGLAAGPKFKLADSNGTPVTQGAEGEVCVAGACVTQGYERRAHMDKDPNEEAFHADGWLRTGDVGYLDVHGYLCLSGRSKEIINRGGEKISPFEVEDACRRFPAVSDCVAFAAPHAQLGEVVGLAVVPKAEAAAASGAAAAAAAGGLDPSALAGLHAFLGEANTMSKKWWPECWVYLEKIPRGSTGKLARIGLAQRLDLPTFDAQEQHPLVWSSSGGIALPLAPSRAEGRAAAASSKAPAQSDSAGGGRVANDTILDSLGLVLRVSRERLNAQRLMDNAYAMMAFFVLTGHWSMSTIFAGPTMMQVSSGQFLFLLPLHHYFAMIAFTAVTAYGRGLTSYAHQLGRPDLVLLAIYLLCAWPLTPVEGMWKPLADGLYGAVDDESEEPLGFLGTVRTMLEKLSAGPMFDTGSSPTPLLFQRWFFQVPLLGNLLCAVARRLGLCRQFVAALGLLIAPFLEALTRRAPGVLYMSSEFCDEVTVKNRSMAHALSHPLATLTAFLRPLTPLPMCAYGANVHFWYLALYVVVLCETPVLDAGLKRLRSAGTVGLRRGLGFAALLLCCTLTVLDPLVLGAMRDLRQGDPAFFTNAYGIQRWMTSAGSDGAMGKFLAVDPAGRPTELICFLIGAVQVVLFIIFLELAFPFHLSFFGSAALPIYMFHSEVWHLLPLTYMKRVAPQHGGIVFLLMLCVALIYMTAVSSLSFLVRRVSLRGLLAQAKKGL